MTAATLILATDLDGTLAGGTAPDRARLVELLLEQPAVRLIYVTGRTPDGARAVIESANLPQPAVLIADVGTTVLHGTGPEPVAEIEAELAAAWPGSDIVRERLASESRLSLQDIAPPRRVSYWIEPVRRRRDVAAGADPYAARDPGDASMGQESARMSARVAADAAEAMRDLSVDVLVSANVFLDVLPRGVNKGSTLRRVLRWLAAEDGVCVVAGDSLNDLALFETGLRGIVVGNCEPALPQQVAHLPDVYLARAAGAAGVLEGLRHHGYLGGNHGE